MKSRTAKSRTADLFAAEGVSPSPAPAPTREPAPAREPVPSPAPALGSRQREALRAVKAGGEPPTPHAAGHVRSRQLWYAVVFPDLAGMEHAAAELQRLGLHAHRFTSFVSIEPPNALLLEIRGSLRLLGPLARLHTDIDACWQRLALPARSATAPSTLAALWMARGGPPRSGTAMHGVPPDIEDFPMLPGRLADLPIACTAWDDERLQILRSMGVTRMGELLRLPRAGLARRLGVAAVQDLDIALGRQSAPRRAFVPRERFRARRDLETEIENAAYLEKALEPLMEHCARFLRERQAGVQALRLRLRHRAGPATCVHLGLASVTGERRRLTGVLAQKLARLELRAPVRVLELISGSLQPLSSASLDVFAGLAGIGARTGSRQGRDSVPQLVERLRARLGEEAVYGVASIPEHRPEAAWRRVRELSLAGAQRMTRKMAERGAVEHGAGELGAGERGAGEGMPRPVWLLDAPLPLPEQGTQPHRSGLVLEGSGLVLEEGPERIETGWWDGKGVARDYYVARQVRGTGARPSHGAKLWVFQERQSRRWYLHGMFA